MATPREYSFSKRETEMERPVNWLIFPFCMGFLLCSAAIAWAQTANTQTLEGIWVGTLEIPNAAKLRMGITVSKSTAALNIIDQATGDIPIDETVYEEDRVTFRLNRLGIAIVGTVDFDQGTITSEFRQHGAVFPIIFHQMEEMPKLSRPQEPKEPFPYSSEEVTYENEKAGIKLSGTITVPTADGKVPAVLLLSGSGQQGRDQDIGGHKPFWVIADYLSRNGIAVLRVDDRGFGGSTGNFERSTSGDFAQDALAGVAFLSKRKEINKDQIGLIGHSEGGIIAALAASNSEDIAFIVSMAGPGVNLEDLFIAQILNNLKLEGVEEENLKLHEEWRRKAYAIVKEPIDSAAAAKKLWDAYAELSEDQIQRLNWPEGRMRHTIPSWLNPWRRFAMTLDTKETIMKVKCPYLAIYGEKDIQVNADKNMAAVEEALKAGGNRHYTVKKLPELNHLFQTAGTGSEYEYVQIEETISPKVLTLIGDWILEQTSN